MVKEFYRKKILVLATRYKKLFEYGKRILQKKINLVLATRYRKVFEYGK